MRFELYPSRRGLLLRKQWRWRLISSNGRNIAVSSESYNNLDDALQSIRLVQKHAAGAGVHGKPITLQRAVKERV